MVEAYEFVIFPVPRPEIPPKELSVPLVLVNDPRKKTLFNAATPLPSTPPDLHTPETAAIEYDSETDPYSEEPTTPPAPPEQVVVVEMTLPVVHDVEIVELFRRNPTMPPTQSPPVIDPVERDPVTAMFVR